MHRGARYASPEREIKSYEESTAEVPLEQSTTKQANHSDLSSVIRNAFSGTDNEEARRGRLLGCRHDVANRTSGLFKSASNIGIISIPPDCPASNFLRANFRCSRDLTIIEDWVDSIISEEDRGLCFGRTAISRAKRKLRVAQVDDERLPHDGELRLVDGWLVAFIGKDQSWQRETFTIAHELGHAALYGLNREVDQTTPGTERLCDMFAAELIMPTRLVTDIWRKTPDVEAIVELGKKSASSLPAACIRLAEYLGNASTGIASENGVVRERYGVNLGRDLTSSLDLVSRKAIAGKFSSDLPNGLTLSVQHARKGQMVFLARRIG